MIDLITGYLVRIEQLESGSPEVYTGELENIKELIQIYDETYNEVK